MSPAVFSLDKYIELARKASTHQARLTVLSSMLDDVFGVKLEDLLPGIEKKIGSSILGVKGSIDLLYSNVVFEVKTNLSKELDDAKKGLKKYFQALLEEKPYEKFIGIATDVIKYIAFVPIVKNSIVIDIKEISSIDISEVSASEAILWLDSHIFSTRKIPPTANDLKFRFGPKSPSYAIAMEILKSLWELVKDEEDVKLKYELWSKNMEIVYGSRPNIEAYLDQTYLVTLTKLIVYLRLNNGNSITTNEILRALKGEYFVDYGVMNLIEEDFFTWILHNKVRDKSLELMYSISRELQRYDLTQIDEDFFKEIYQEIVERGQRHRVGEYYTPEWLTELILNEVIEFKLREKVDPPRILDPACGSGTFLCNAIHILKKELKRRGWIEQEILNFVLANIVGIDINPLAVTIARANYLLALGELLNARKGPILLPVYVADSIKLPPVLTTLHENINIYEYVVNNTRLQIPVGVAKDRNRMGIAIAALKEAVKSYMARRNKLEAQKVFERFLQNSTSREEFNILKSTLNNILSLIDKGRDSIWIYMLSNIYTPVALRESKFDIIVGNPPWIVMRSIKNPEYQEFLKNKVFEYELLDRSQTHLFTQMECATLFYCRCADLYLKDQGIIAFVMPRSVLTGALHHQKFKQFRKPKMKLIKIYDLENVSPLFNVPSCVLISIKGDSTSYPVPSKKFNGSLPSKNIRLQEALKFLSITDYMYEPPATSQRYSYYYDHVKAGASIYPRCFYFVDFISHQVLGIDVRNPLVKSSEEIIGQEPWKNVKLSGKVEAEFIYATLLGGDILPFGYTKLRPVVLPIEKTFGGYNLLDVDDLRNRGYTNTANWFEQAQKIWEKLATEKNLKEYPRLINYIDYNGTLRAQDPSKRYLVLSNAAGKNVVSCVIDREKLEKFFIDHNAIAPRGFVAEKKTIYYETNCELEAHYLCAILNSDVVNKAIKSFQTKGLWGERDIVRRPFMLPIPKFNPNNQVHRKLAELSKICHNKVSRTTSTKKSVAYKRKEAKEVIEKELEEINDIVTSIIG
jgi:methylase of polypeptide subunit release factors